MSLPSRERQTWPQGGLTRRTIKSFLTLAAVTMFSACSDSSGPNGSNGAVIGSYTLISINGLAVPVVINVDQFGTFRISSGNLTLSANNTFTSSVVFEQTPVGGQPMPSTETCTGTYQVTGNSITFTESGSTNTNCSGQFNGTWDGSDTLTVALDVAVQAVFRK
jgi:heat shock protein HslJ